MATAADVAGLPALVASHERQITAKARHQNRQKRKSDPASHPMTVAVRAVAWVDVIALLVGHAVVEKTRCALQTRDVLDTLSDAIDRRVRARATFVMVLRKRLSAVHARQHH